MKKQITIEEIKSLAKPLPLGGKQTRLETETFWVSIVGGRNGLYGDFEEDFEVAVIDKKTNEFITSFFSGLGDAVIPYMKTEELIDFLNSLTKKDFQV